MRRSLATLLVGIGMLPPVTATLGAQPRRGRVAATVQPSAAPAARPSTERVLMAVPPTPPAMPAPMMLVGVTRFSILGDGRALADFGGAERLLHHCSAIYPAYSAYYYVPFDAPRSFIDRPPEAAPPARGVQPRASTATAAAPQYASAGAQPQSAQGAAHPGVMGSAGGAYPVYLIPGTMCYYVDVVGRFTVLRF